MSNRDRESTSNRVCENSERKSGTVVAKTPPSRNPMLSQEQMNVAYERIVLSWVVMFRNACMQSTETSSTRTSNARLSSRLQTQMI